MIGGYSSKIFESKPSEKFDCPLCYETLKDPLQCSNGHPFCKTCILSVLERKDSCPLCGTFISLSLLSKSLFVQLSIGKLTTFCVSQDCELIPPCWIEESVLLKSCTWIGPLHARNQHYETECEYFVTKCENAGCEVQLFRKSVIEHNQVCLFAKVKCGHCNELYSRQEMAQHIDSCGHRPVLCPRNCSAILSFSQVEAHLQNDCPNQKATSHSNLIILDAICAEVAGSLNDLALCDDRNKRQDSVTTLSSKSSKKNAKKAAKRKNPTTSASAVEDASRGNVVLLNSLVEEFLSAEDICQIVLGSAAKSVGLGDIIQFVSDFKKQLDLCPPSEFYRQLTVIFITHKNSATNRIRENRIDWSIAVALSFLLDVRFYDWLTEKSHEVVEIRYLSDRLAEVSGALTSIKNVSEYSFTEWLRRRNYQASVEITVSGCYESAADGKYRFSVSGSLDTVFEKVDKSTAHTIRFHGSKDLSWWSLCNSICPTNDSRSEEFATTIPLYSQETTESALPSETMPWVSPAHPSPNKMKISIKRIIDV